MRLLLVTLSLAGVAVVLPIVQKQITATAPCPTLGPVPACYLVLLGYILIVVSALLVPRYRFRTFAVGWVPLFVLALMASGVELFAEDTCPQTSGGVPTCFVSLGLLSLIAVMYGLERRNDAGKAEKGANI